MGQSPPQHTGRNGSTISMYGRRASGRKNYATCTQSRTAGFGDLTRTVALEQFRAYLRGEPGPVRVNAWEILKLKIQTPAA